MNEHFLEYIEIKNHKCFDDFRAEGFKRVNLIGGKNNVGKTAFLEGCYVNVYSQSRASFVSALINVRYLRDEINILVQEVQESGTLHRQGKTFIEKSDKFSTQSNVNETHFEIHENQGIKEYHCKFAGEDFSVNANEFSLDARHLSNITFLNHIGLNNTNFETLFSTIQRKDAEERVNRYLQSFDNEITGFKMINQIPHCKKNGEYFELSNFGDGLKHFISIIISLFHCENGYLFIDEIDTGIHYSKLKLIWDIVFELSQEFGVQVFVTTHSKECITSYEQSARKNSKGD